MENKKVLDMMNDQMNFEFYSAHIYLGMAGYCAEIGLKGFENWFKVQYQEEVDHAMKFFDYINSRGGRATITNFEEIENNYKDIMSVLNEALSHEKLVSSKIHEVAKVALSEADLSSFSFIQWFIDEQVEEEETVSDIIASVERVDGVGLYLVDKELSARTFVPSEK